jgi:hypothetical protein
VVLPVLGQLHHQQQVVLHMSQTQLPRLPLLLQNLPRLLTWLLLLLQLLLLLLLLTVRITATAAAGAAKHMRGLVS